MAKLNKECIVCGKKYSFCNSCNEDLNRPFWMNDFHDENCKNIYHACAGYSAKHKTKEEARKILDECDLSDKASFTPITQKLIAEIYLSEDACVSEEKKDTKNNNDDSVGFKSKQNKPQYRVYGNKQKKK